MVRSFLQIALTLALVSIVRFLSEASELNPPRLSSLSESEAPSSLQSQPGDPKGADRQSYKLGPGDMLKISVWKDESLSKEILIRPDGYLSFPLIGDINVAGKTVEEVKKEVTHKLAPYIPDPSVSVELLKVNFYKIYVIGRVNRPGEYLVSSPPDVIQALSLAGGLTPFAEENQIKVIRKERGENLTFRFRFGDIKKGKNLEQNILLMPGDEVIVP